MSNKKYDTSIKKQREGALILLTALLVIIATIYSLYISQNADFFSLNMFGDVYFINDIDGKKVYGIILLLSTLKLLMVLGLLKTNDLFKKTMYAFSCLISANLLGLFTFGAVCPEIVNLGVYACQQTQLIEGKSNLLITLLLGFIFYKGYQKIEGIQKESLRIENV